MKYKNGNIYNDDWEKGTKTGKGIMKYSKAIYEGEWKNNLHERKGKVIYFLEEGKIDVYEGEFKNHRQGKGKYKYSNGNVYNGDWYCGLREGWGSMKYSDGIYVGEWKKDKREGKGTMTWVRGERAGDEYNGDWKDDEENGYGKLTQEDDLYYEGEWKDGYFHGKGIRKYDDGIYEGDFKYDKRDGQGKMTYNEKYKGVYEGGWKNGKKHGKGTSTEYGERYAVEYYEGEYIPPSVGRKAGRYLDVRGNLLGRVDGDGNYYDERGIRRGQMFNDGEIRDENNNIIGRFVED